MIVDQVPDPGAENYRGESAFSETETVALRDFMAGRNFSATLNFHTYSPALIYPFGYQAIVNPDSLTYRYLAGVMTADNGYRSGAVWQTLGPSYRVNGEFTDWQYADSVYLNGGIMAFTAEIGRGTDGFWAPKNRIKEIAEYNLSMNLNLARLCDFWPAIDSIAVYTDESDSSLVEIVPLVRNSGIKDAPSGFVIEVTDAPQGVEILQGQAVYSSLPPMSVHGFLPDQPLRLSVSRYVRVVKLAVGSGLDIHYTIPFVIRGGPIGSNDINGDGNTNIFDLLNLLTILDDLSSDEPGGVIVEPTYEGLYNIYDLLSLLLELAETQ